MKGILINTREVRKRKVVSFSPDTISPRAKIKCPNCGSIGHREGKRVYNEKGSKMLLCKSCDQWSCDKACWFGESEYCSMCFLERFSKLR